MNLFQSAVDALYSSTHQARTPEAIERSALRRTRTVADMREYLKRIGLSPAAFERRKLVHITGTKGKGSTACLCEAILRKHGFRTGLFTSPHLVDIRERIRVDGLPVSKAVFGAAYWECRRRLEEYESVSCDESLPVLPGYFRMLTLLALYIFANLRFHGDSQSIDVIILEVGMGGRYDATNCINLSDWQSYACGITKLDYDHVRILGSRLEQIAWEKGGIFKQDKLGGLVSERPSGSDEAMNLADKLSLRNGSGTCRFFALDPKLDTVRSVLLECASVEGLNSDLQFVSRHDFRVPKGTIIGLAGEHQRDNSELAVALCSAVCGGQLQQSTTLEALSTAQWLGRCQTIELKSDDGETAKPMTTRIRLDGAHTVDSVKAGLEWFKQQRYREEEIPCFLIFNCSHERNPVELLEHFIPFHFERVYFCRADSERPSAVSKKTALELLQENGKTELSTQVATVDAAGTWQETLGAVWKCLVGEKVQQRSVVLVNTTVKQAFDDIERQQSDTSNTKEVLVAGSLYLVGSALNVVGWSEGEAEGELQDM